MSVEPERPAREPEQSAHFELGDLGGHARFSLRWYGSDALARATWWVGVFAESGDLTRSAVFLPRPSVIHPDELARWLESHLSAEVAGRLAGAAAEAHPEKFGVPLPD